MTPDADSSFEAMLREAAELRVPAPDAARLPELGELLQAKYRIEERLGVGGMGAVFRATNVENGKQVAIKCLLSRSPRACARFTREGQLAAQIAHPNVVNVFDVGTHHSDTFLVMELLRGTSLRSRLRAGSLAGPELVSLMLPVLRGVRAAHAAGVIHRDLKPDNVFLSVASDGTALEPKVLDFGISKLRGDAAPGERLTAEGSGLGTLAYMSPEQLVDAPNVDERTDIYSAGVMMYEALAGRPPFQADSYNALVLAIAAQRPASIRELAEDVDPALESIVMRAMASDARERHASVDALLDDLARWSRGASAEPLPRQGGAHPPQRRSRSPLVLLGALVAVTLAGGAWLALRAPRPRAALVQTLAPGARPGWSTRFEALDGNAAVPHASAAAPVQQASTPLAPAATPAAHPDTPRLSFTRGAASAPAPSRAGSLRRSDL